MTAYAESMIDFHRIELYPLAVSLVGGISHRLVAVRALLELPGFSNVLNRVMAAYAGDSCPRFVPKGLIRIDLSFVLSVVEHHPAPAAGRVELDRYPLGALAELEVRQATCNSLYTAGQY
jgi:hypothetical protein